MKINRENVGYEERATQIAFCHDLVEHALELSTAYRGHLVLANSQYGVAQGRKFKVGHGSIPTSC